MLWKRRSRLGSKLTQAHAPHARLARYRAMQEAGMAGQVIIQDTKSNSVLMMEPGEPEMIA